MKYLYTTLFLVIVLWSSGVWWIHHTTSSGQPPISIQLHGPTVDLGVKSFAAEEGMQGLIVLWIHWHSTDQIESWRIPGAPALPKRQPSPYELVV